MRNALPLALIVLAVGLGLWLFLGGEDPVPPLVDLGDGGGPDAAATGPDGLQTLEAPALDASGRPRPTPRRRPPTAVDPRSVPRGVLAVRCVGKDDQPVPLADLRVDVAPTARKDWRRQVARLDETSGTWVFEDVLAGPVRVDVRGDHVLDASATGTVQANAPAEVTVVLSPGGAIRYEAVLSGEERPTQVTLALLDAAEKPVTAWYQVRTPRAITTPRRVAGITQGPEGVIFGLPAGAYRLRIETEAGVHDEAGVEVVAGETASVRFELGR